MCVHAIQIHYPPFGDFVELSHIVDGATANYLKKEASDGIIAPGYTDEALQLLSKKKGGKYIILQASQDVCFPEHEIREIMGVGFMQLRNTSRIDGTLLQSGVINDTRKLVPSTVTDLNVAHTCLKYTHSNSVGSSYRGQMLGIGAGQQSRVDCVKLSTVKTLVWQFRFHPVVMGMKFKAKVSRPQKINAIVRYIEGNMVPVELAF